MERTKRAVRIVALLLGAACAAGGCAATRATAPTTEDDPAASLLEHHRHHHHGGVTLLVAMSLDSLGVSAEQEAAIEVIRADLHARMEAARGAERRLLGTLADGLEGAPGLDASAVDADLAKATAAVVAVHDASLDAMVTLHEALTPVQRAALVDKLEAHWAVWRSANGAEPGPAGARDGPPSMLTEGLDLTAAESARIRAKLQESPHATPRFDPAEVALRLHALGDAFRGERFDPRAVAGGHAANEQLGAWGVARMARFVAAARAVLTPAQRAALGGRLREHAAHDALGRRMP
jgi:Spy/CpxP family protein refolding chaperone